MAHPTVGFLRLQVDSLQLAMLSPIFKTNGLLQEMRKVLEISFNTVQMVRTGSEQILRLLCEVEGELLSQIVQH